MSLPPASPPRPAAALPPARRPSSSPLNRRMAAGHACSQAHGQGRLPGSREARARGESGALGWCNERRSVGAWGSWIDRSIGQVIAERDRNAGVSCSGPSAPCNRAFPFLAADRPIVRLFATHVHTAVIALRRSSLGLLSLCRACVLRPCVPQAAPAWRVVALKADCALGEARRQTPAAAEDGAPAAAAGPAAARAAASAAAPAPRQAHDVGGRDRRGHGARGEAAANAAGALQAARRRGR